MYGKSDEKYFKTKYRPAGILRNVNPISISNSNHYYNLAIIKITLL